MTPWIDRFSLCGRKALVTGASKEIGAGLCGVFAQEMVELTDAALFLVSDAPVAIDGDLLMVEGGCTRA